jgi:hypothetical protein
MATDNNCPSFPDFQFPNTTQIPNGGFDSLIREPDYVNGKFSKPSESWKTARSS